MKKRMILLSVLVICCALLCACKQNPTEEVLFAKLLDHFQQRGYSCTLSRVEDTGRDVPIYKASVWHSLMLDGEEVLVYFDESNRADYLSEPIDESVYGHKARMGLRFVLVYPGENEGIVQALKELPQ